MRTRGVFEGLVEFNDDVGGVPVHNNLARAGAGAAHSDAGAIRERLPALFDTARDIVENGMAGGAQ